MREFGAIAESMEADVERPAQVPELTQSAAEEVYRYFHKEKEEQVNIALQVLGEMGLTIPVCGMVKDDHHRTRGLYYNNREIPIDRSGEAFKLITRIQDEAHRFAIEYHRSLRGKAQTTSRLDEIPGIGPARKKALMREFGSIAEIMEADAERLAQVPEIPESTAEEIYRFFHKEETE